MCARVDDDRGCTVESLFLPLAAAAAALSDLALEGHFIGGGALSLGSSRLKEGFAQDRE